MAIIIGTNGLDWLWGTDGSDLINGKDGADVIFGGKGSDLILGGAGNDHLHGERGHDIISGGDGDDHAYGGRGNDSILGEDGNDHLEGGHGADTLEGGNGTDILLGGSGNDILLGGNGTDFLEGGTGTDFLNGGAGFDFVTFAGATGGVYVHLHYGISQDNTGVQDQLVGIEGVLGTDFKDTITGDQGDNWVFGGGGDDDLFGLDGADTIGGGEGNDELMGEGGRDEIHTGLGQDFADGGLGYDTLTLSESKGDAGWEIHARDGHAAQRDGSATTDFINFEEIIGSDRDDIFWGSDARESFNGGDGDDIVIGAGGDDMLHSGKGWHDILLGGNGNDYLIADEENVFTQMTGGTGADHFMFLAKDYSLNHRGTVTDFDRDEGDQLMVYKRAPFDPDSPPTPLGQPGDPNPFEFIFLGQGAFTGNGHGEYRVGAIDGGTRVHVDDDGDGYGDWWVDVMTDAGHGLLTASDFFFD